MSWKNFSKSLKKRRKYPPSIGGRSKAVKSKTSRSTDKQEQFSRRAFLVTIGQGGVLSLLAVRMGWLQIAEADKYKTLAEDNRVNLLMLAPQRGLIVDRFGVPLAINVRDYRAVIIPEKAEDMESILKELRKYISYNDGTIEEVLKKSKKVSRFVPIEIVNNLDWEDLSKIEVNRPSLPGVFVETGEIRSYPLKESTSHLIGYVGRVSEKELSGNPVELLPGYKIGKSALEKQFNDELKGKPGQREVEVNATGREVRDLTVVAPTSGDRLTLSVDIEYQRFAQEVLSKHKSAAAVVMDAHTGAVYALASHPSFDPNLFVDGIGTQAWNELLNDPTFPLTNKAVAGQYPPGSTFKMMTAMAGLEAGVIEPNTTVVCPGYYKLGNGKFHCWKNGGHGRMNLKSALEQSCDVFFYKLSTSIGIDKIAEVSKRFGLGENLGFELPEEKNGFIPSKYWKKKRFGEKWQPGETVINSIGQGYVLTTPLQLATMTARLVNGGKEVKPWLSGFMNEKPLIPSGWKQMDIDPKHLELIKQGMDAVILGEQGTARGSRIPDETMSMGGKTGTSQVRRITKAERATGRKRQEDLPWNERHHALFVGYAPTNNPRYICSVIVEHGIGGSSAAAPLAKELLWEIQKRNPAESPFLPNGGMASFDTQQKKHG